MRLQVSTVYRTIVYYAITPHFILPWKVPPPSEPANVTVDKALDQGVKSGTVEGLCGLIAHSCTSGSICVYIVYVCACTCECMDRACTYLHVCIHTHAYKQKTLQLLVCFSTYARECVRSM